MQRRTQRQDEGRARPSLSWFPGLLGIRESEDGYTFRFRWSPEAPLGSGRIVAVALFALLIPLFLWSLVTSPYFSPVGLVEEGAYTYTSANNYLKYGFARSGFLQDMSTSSDPADHPYAYNHMPPGPDIFTALMLKVSGRSYRFVRLTYGLIFLAGVVFYIKFADLILGSFGLIGGAYAVLFLGPRVLLQLFDRHTHFSFPLLAFSPLIALQAYYRTGRRRYIYAALVIGLLSSVVLEYVTLSAVIYCWILLYVTQLVRLDRSHLLAFLGVLGLGIFAHLLQNFLYLGPALFFKELGMVLSNRIVGFPTMRDLKLFYDSVGLVHHGSHPIHVGAFLFQLLAGLRFPAAIPVGLAALVLAASIVWWDLQYDRAEGVLVVRRGKATEVLAHFGKVAVWIAGTVTLPLMMFPAFAQEVSLYGSGTSLYFVGMGATAVLLYALRKIVQLRPLWPGYPGKFGSKWLFASCLWIGLIVAFALSVEQVASVHVEKFAGVIPAYRQNRYARLEDLRRYFAGQLTMTNINAVTVGFLTQEAGFGVCGPEAVPDRGSIDPQKCYVAFMRRHDHYAKVRPRYFVFFWSRDLFPGFADCLPSGILLGQERGGDSCVAVMHRRLSERFQRVFDNGVFEVFDLHAESPRKAS